MTPLYLFIGILIQGILISCNDTSNFHGETIEYEILPLEVHRNKPMIDSIDREAKDEFFQQFFGGSAHLYPSQSVEMMNHVTSSDKSPEDQIQSIKEIAEAIGNTIENEMINLLSFAMAGTEKLLAAEDKSSRGKRSADTPMGSAELVMRLLKHIKSNNEHQNIAIDKMMTAQEIADKFGIEFRPDPEILTDLAVAGTEQAKELTNILKDACDTKNETLPLEYSFVSMTDEGECSVETMPDNNNYYSYHPEYEQPPMNVAAIEEYKPEPINRHNHHGHHHQPTQPQANKFETQIPVPPMQPHPNQYQHHHNHPHPHHPSQHSAHPQPQQMEEAYRMPPVSQRPNFYDAPFTPAPQFPPSCSILEPFTTGAIFLPVEEIYEPEPELVGEEYEETMSSKVIVDHGDEPGSATVNHVMTYTLSEKAHFRTPEIQRLPEQMQYTFFLM